MPDGNDDPSVRRGDGHPGAEAGPRFEREGGADWQQPGPYTGFGPGGYQRSDSRIHEEVSDRLTQAGQLDAREIVVEVHEGEVTLQGQVPDRRSKRLAEQIAESVAGVRDVHNQLLLSNAYAIHNGIGMLTGYGEIQTGMYVAGSDGKTIGRVKEVRDTDFLVDRSLARDIYIPFSAVATVANTWLSIAVPAKQVDLQDWPRPGEQGQEPAE